jgi:uncharacterized damage-inducible protein DinB
MTDHIPIHPAGPFTRDPDADASRHVTWIAELAALPAELRAAAAGLSDAQLDVPYRPGAWTGRQIIHHVADSHMNCYIRCKWTLTESEPLIKAYDETSWANLPDSREGPIDAILDLLDALHRAWTDLLRRLEPRDWERRFRHPETGDEPTLHEAMEYYVWHGRHHCGQILSIRRRAGLPTIDTP